MFQSFTKYFVLSPIDVKLIEVSGIPGSVDGNDPSVRGYAQNGPRMPVAKILLINGTRLDASCARPRDRLRSTGRTT